VRGGKERKGRRERESEGGFKLDKSPRSWRTLGGGKNRK